ncbi:uncharacterized protein LOC109538888 [Dendroctonus ponderosae]
MCENIKIPDPEWILDKNGNGHLIWRRDIDEQDTNSRVRFKHDVEVKEFHRKSYELIEPPWVREAQPTNVMSMGVTCLVCVTVTLILPWYLMGGRNLFLALANN